MVKLYAKKETVRKYYKYVDTPWSQPVLTENGTLGGSSFAVNANRVNTTQGGYPYCAFDNVPNTGYSPSGSGWENYGIFYFYNPNPLNVTTLNLINHSDLITGYLPSDLIIKGSNDYTNWTSIQTFTGLSGVINVNVNNSNYYKYYSLEFTGSQGSNQIWIGQINITATQLVVQESTEDDYDFYKDVEVYKMPKKSVTKYWKYIYESWTQPVLNSNGTLGGDSFAVSNTTHTQELPSYYMFDNNGSTYAQYFTSNNAGKYFIFYNPNKLNVTQLAFTYYPATWIKDADFYGSDDNSTWELIGKINHSGNTGTTTFAENNKYYKYHKVFINSANGFDGRSYVIADIYNLNITATQQMIIDGTPDDYDFTTTEDIYYASMQGGN